MACGIENGEGRDTGWRSLSTFNAARHPALPVLNLTLACNHCDTPVCALGCPADAYHRDPQSAAVILDGSKCIGCHYCSWLCPYDAPKFDEDEGVMSKCTFCSPRLAAGGEPACTQACPTGALSLGSRLPGEPEPDLAGLGRFGLGPALSITPPRARIPVDAAEDDEPPPSPSLPPRKIDVGREWALLLFTTIMPALVAWLGAGLLVPAHSPGAFAFVTLGGAALVLSTLHLGKPLRAWRAVLNVRTSWLSREIVFANLFLLLGAVWLSFPRFGVAVGWAAFACGVALAWSIDHVYRAIPRDEPMPFHSAETMLGVVLLFGIAAGARIVAWPAAALIVALFVFRKASAATRTPDEWVFAFARIALLVTAVIILRWPEAFAMGVASFALDRLDFYDELEPTTPLRRMARRMVISTPAKAAPSVVRRSIL
ncbi:MAG: DmsC/YnfH family molybdoenzyme membrane anchor subunit [Thermoanaerobaculia bacterium]